MPSAMAVRRIIAAAVRRGAGDARALERRDAMGGRDRRVALAVAETAAGITAIDGLSGKARASGAGWAGCYRSLAGGWRR
jgi:hypothetical protein